MLKVTRLFAAILIVAVSPYLAHAGTLGGPVSWITQATPTDSLVVNNDDYIGEVAGNPNKFVLNETSRGEQTIDRIERMIPTLPSGGITEYVMQIMSGINVEDEFPPPTRLDNQFQLQLGFGMGKDFVPASQVAAGLQFDAAELVSPPIADLQNRPGRTPFLRLIAHQSDTLTFQGSTTVTDPSMPGAQFLIGQVYFDSLMVPLDVPDLAPSLRERYTADQLALLPAEANVPFTVRMLIVPEPSTFVMALLAATASVVCASGCCVRRRSGQEERNGCGPAA